VAGMMKNRHLSKAVQEQMLLLITFTRILWISPTNWIQSAMGRDKSYLSRQILSEFKICIKCGRIKKDLKLSERIYSCECGNVIDRDLQAAINLIRYIPVR
jgi:putative transposase